MSETVIIIVDNEPHYVEYRNDYDDFYGLYHYYGLYEDDEVLPLTIEEAEGLGD